MKVRFAVSLGGGVPDGEGLVSVLTETERQGFDSVWFSDLPILPSIDPLLAVALAAGVTSRLKLGVNLVPFGSEPFVVARRLAQADRISGGRLLVTLVPGLDQPGERTALGTVGRHRGRLMDAIIPVLRTLWSGGTIAGPDGGEGVSLAVVPHQDPLEIWLGGSTPEAARRTGTLADGWLGALMSPPDAGAMRERIQKEADAVGRTVDPEHFGMSVGYAREASDLDSAVRLRRPGGRDTRHLVPVGAAALRDLLDQLIDQGLSKFVVRRVSPVTSWSDELSWLADAVLARQT